MGSTTFPQSLSPHKLTFGLVVIWGSAVSTHKLAFEGSSCLGGVYSI